MSGNNGDNDNNEELDDDVKGFINSIFGISPLVYGQTTPTKSSNPSPDTTGSRSRNESRNTNDTVNTAGAQDVPERTVGVSKRGKRFRVDANIDGQRLIITFDTLEQAALAFLYAKHTAAEQHDSLRSQKTLDEALTSSSYYRNLYANLDSLLDKQNTNGINIRDKVDDFFKIFDSKNNKRMKPT